MVKHDYISREAAVSQILDKVWTKTDEDGYIWVLRRDVIHTLDDIPAADVRPVVRADLIIVKLGIHPFRRIKCSACHNECWIGSEEPKYCHKCGAMFEKTIEEELQEHMSIDEFNAIMEGTIHDTRTQG